MPCLPPIAILAGGLGTRLHPITQTIPKAMVEVAGEPFVAHQLRLLKRQGVGEVVFCVGHIGKQIEDYVGNGHAFGLSVRWSYDGEPLLGTGGAIRKALPLLGDSFLVTYGDSYLDLPYQPIYDTFKSSHCLGLMTVFCNDNAWDASNVEFAGGRIVAYDKKRRTEQMHHIDFGLLAFQRDAFADWRDVETFDLAALLGGLVAKGELAGFETRDRFYEVGSHAGLDELDRLLSTQGKNG